MTSTNLIRLNTLTTGFEDLQAEFKEYKQVSEKKISILRALYNQSEAQTEELRERVAFLEELLEVDSGNGSTAVILGTGQTAGTENDAEEPEIDGVVEGDGPGTVPGEDEDADEKAKNKSEEAMNSKPVKDAVNKVFQHFLGITKLDAASLPPYPFQISREHESWPKDTVTQAPLVRFDWDKSYNHEINQAGLKEVLLHVRTRGASFVPTAKVFLGEITDNDLRARIRKKWDYMASQWKARKKAELKLAEKQRREEEWEDDAEQEEIDEQVLNRAKKNSRAEAVLAARKRKRPLSEYMDSKYDSAFILNAMSDYEDDPDRRPNEPNRYIRRVPDYRSEQLIRLYDDIDKIPDPLPDKERAMTTRKNGSVIKGALPPVARNLANRLRAWQVNPQLLEANPHWMGRRVAANGIAWGEEKDPEDEHSVNRAKRKSGIISGGAKKKRRVSSAKAGVDRAAENLQRLLGDKGIADVFESG